MPTTSRGFPYPASTDAADGPAAIQALANQIETVLDNDLTLGGQQTRFGVGGTLRSVAANSAQFRSNYDPATDRLIDTSKPSWALMAGDGASDRFVVYRAAPTASSPTYVALAYVGAGGALTIGNTLSVPSDASVGGDLTVAGDINGRSSLASPYFRAYRSTAASYADGATVVFDSETDPNGWYDNATGIFLPTVAGTYRVACQVQSPGLASGKTLVAGVLGGSGGLLVTGSRAPYNAAYGSVSCGAQLVAFNGTTDSAHVVVAHDNGGALAVTTGQANTFFEAEYVGV